MNDGLDKSFVMPDFYVARAKNTQSSSIIWPCG